MDSKKVKVWVKEKAMKVKSVIWPWAIAIIPGVIIGGSVTALRDSSRITKLENRFNKHQEIGNQNVDIHNKFVDWTHDEIDRLTRQNNELMERALRETEGKAS